MKAAHLLRCLDLDQIDGLAEARLGCHDGSIGGTAAGRNDLPASSVDGVGMENHITNLNHNTAHVLLAQDALLQPFNRISHLAVIQFSIVHNILVFLASAEDRWHFCDLTLSMNQQSQHFLGLDDYC